MSEGRRLHCRRLAPESLQESGLRNGVHVACVVRCQCDCLRKVGSILTVLGKCTAQVDCRFSVNATACTNATSSPVLIGKAVASSDVNACQRGPSGLAARRGSGELGTTPIRARRSGRAAHLRIHLRGQAQGRWRRGGGATAAGEGGVIHWMSSPSAQSQSLGCFAAVASPNNTAVQPPRLRVLHWNGASAGRLSNSTTFV